MHSVHSPSSHCGHQTSDGLEIWRISHIPQKDGELDMLLISCNILVVLNWKSTFIYCHFDICTPLKLINQNQIEFPNNTPFAGAVLFYIEDTIGNQTKYHTDRTVLYSNSKFGELYLEGYMVALVQLTKMSKCNHAINTK